jgi:hypothetical protein
MRKMIAGAVALLIALAIMAPIALSGCKKPAGEGAKDAPVADTNAKAKQMLNSAKEGMGK